MRLESGTAQVCDCESGRAIDGPAPARARAGAPPPAAGRTACIEFDFPLPAAAHGAERTLFLLPPGQRGLRGPFDAQVASADAPLTGLGHGTGRIKIVEDEDSDALSDRLHALVPVSGLPGGSLFPPGRKRSLEARAPDGGPGGSET